MCDVPLTTKRSANFTIYTHAGTSQWILRSRFVTSGNITRVQDGRKRSDATDGRDESETYPVIL